MFYGLKHYLKLRQLQREKEELCRCYDKKTSNAQKENKNGDVDEIQAVY